MKRFMLVALTAAGLSGCIYASSRREQLSTAPSRCEHVEVKIVRKGERVPAAQVAASLKITLGGAIESALGKVKGQALNAEIEMENGKPMIEVRILSEGKLWEVEIDGTTGAIVEAEQEDDDNDDDDEDDDDGDDD